MTETVKERLWRLVAEARSRPAPPQRRPAAGGRDARALFAPVRKVAEQLAVELERYPELTVTVNPESVWIELYDKHICFAVDAASGRFVADELGYAWLEPELREESLAWDDAAGCADALVQACARYVALAEAIRALEPKPL